MNFVEPIRDPEIIHNICEDLKKTDIRTFIMFTCGIYTGLRISDILKLKVKDVYNRNSITLREKKTGKQRIIEINPVLKKALQSYCEGKDTNEYLIKSKKGYNRPIERDQAYKIMKKLGDKWGVENCGCHTLRKTFGYHYYKQTGDIMTLQQIFNHSHPSICLRYIGINQETMSNAIKNFRF